MDSSIAIVMVFIVASPLLRNLADAAPAIFNVVDFGATGDGKNTDDSPAFSKAWKAVCDSNVTSTLLIPSGTFLLQPISFVGPCKPPLMQIQISGNIAAPMKQWDSCTNNGAWIYFGAVQNLVISGTATINGNGAIWWKEQDVNSNACQRPTGLHFSKCVNIQLRGVHIQDSPRNHIGLNDCQRMAISNVNITAPEYSPNTDGIDISSSSRIVVRESFIGTGDDCIAINGGCKHINITNVVCGPGHGISVGSLGKNGNNDSVEEVHVLGCNFTGTQNGARIKTWEGWTGHAKKISFVNITLDNAMNPIVIDQQYCPRCSRMNYPSAQAISEVTYMGFHGTSAHPRAIALNCSSRAGCHNITMGDVNIETDKHGKTFAVCHDAHGIGYNTVPHVPCLSY